MSISSQKGVDDKPASLQAHAADRVERLRALLDRLETEGGGRGDPLLDAVRSLLADADHLEQDPQRD